VTPDPGFGGLPEDHDENLRGLLDDRLSGLPVAAATAARESMILSPEIIEDGVKSVLGADRWDYHVACIGNNKMLGAAMYEQVALRAYTFDMFGEINNALRYSTGLERVSPVVVAVNSFLSKADVYVGEVYRGVYKSRFGAEFERFLLSHQVGEVVQYNGFTSTSAAAGQKFYGDIQLTIISRSGKNISQHSALPHQQEVLFRSGSKFNVLSRAVDSTGIVRIVLEEIANQATKVPVSHIFDALPEIVETTVERNNLTPEELESSRVFVERCTIEQFGDGRDSQKESEAFREEHGLTQLEVVELYAPEIAEETAKRDGRPLLMTPKRIIEFIKEYGEHPEVYVARVFKSKK
jgi:hypothetical protein